MFNPHYCEALVKREPESNSKPMLILAGGCFLTLAAAVVALFTGFFFLLLFSLAFAFGTWYLYTNEQVEYEYIFSGDELVITKIIAERKRKPMISVSLNRATAFGKLSEAEQLQDHVTLVLACRCQDEDTYYMQLTHESYGEVRLLLTPTERCLQYCSDHLPRTLRFRYHAPEAITESAF